MVAVNLVSDANPESHEEGERNPPSTNSIAPDKYVQAFYDTTYRYLMHFLFKIY